MMGKPHQIDEWYYLGDGNPVGPFTAEALLQLRRASVIGNTLVLRLVP